VQRWPERGTLNAGSIGGHKLTQDWTLDQVGNWAAFKQDLRTWPRPVGQAGAGDGQTWDLEQQVGRATRCARVARAACNPASRGLRRAFGKLHALRVHMHRRIAKAVANESNWDRTDFYYGGLAMSGV